jgi:type VI secretion system secreted protein VgrG
MCEVVSNLSVNDADGGSFKFPAWSQVPLSDVKAAKPFGFSE